MVVNPDGSVTISMVPGYYMTPFGFSNQGYIDAMMARQPPAPSTSPDQIQQLQQQIQQLQQQLQQQKQPPTQYDPWAEDADESTLPPSVFAPQNMPPLNGAMGHGVPSTQTQAASEESSWLPGMETFLGGLGAIGLAALLRKALSTKVLSAVPIPEGPPSGESVLPAGNRQLALPPANPVDASKLKVPSFIERAAANPPETWFPTNERLPGWMQNLDKPPTGPAPRNMMSPIDDPQIVLEEIARNDFIKNNPESRIAQLMRDADLYNSNPAALENEINYYDKLNEIRRETAARNRAQNLVTAEARNRFRAGIQDIQNQAALDKQQRNLNLKEARDNYREFQRNPMGNNQQPPAPPAKPTTTEPTTASQTPQASSTSNVNSLIEKYNKLRESNKVLKQSINVAKVRRGDPIEGNMYDIWQKNVAEEQNLLRQIAANSEGANLPEDIARNVQKLSKAKGPGFARTLGGNLKYGIPFVLGLTALSRLLSAEPAQASAPAAPNPSQFTPGSKEWEDAKLAQIAAQDKGLEPAWNPFESLIMAPVGAGMSLARMLGNVVSDSLLTNLYYGLE